MTQWRPKECVCEIQFKMTAHIMRNFNSFTIWHAGTLYSYSYGIKVGCSIMPLWNSSCLLDKVGYSYCILQCSEAKVFRNLVSTAMFARAECERSVWDFWKLIGVVVYFFLIMEPSAGHDKIICLSQKGYNKIGRNHLQSWLEHSREQGGWNGYVVDQLVEGQSALSASYYG